MRRAGLLALLVALITTAPAVARTVAVPKVTGDVNRAYAVLRAHRLTVSIAHPFTLRNDALSIVTSQRPAAGRRVRPGTAVTLTVRCCRPLAHPPPLGVAPGAFVPAMIGSLMRQVNAWAVTFGRRYRARLAPIRAAAGKTLLSNYIVTRQSLAPNARLLGGSVLGLNAAPGTPPPCTLPYDAYVLLRDRQAVVYQTSTNSVYAVGYDACLYGSGTTERMGVDDQGNGVYDYPDALLGVRIAGVHSTGSDKYDLRPEHAWVVTWDLDTGARTTLYDAGSAPVPQVALAPGGPVVWRLTAQPGSTPGCVNARTCPTTAIMVADGGGVRTLDSVDPSSHDQLSAFTLTGYVVSWTRNGTPESATLQ